MTRTVCGVVFFVDEHEKVLVFGGVGQDAIAAAWPEIAAEYDGWAAIFKFRDVMAPVVFLNEIGAWVAEDFVVMGLLPKDFIDVAENGHGPDDVRGKAARMAKFAGESFAKDPDAMPELFVLRDDYLEMGAALHVGFLKIGYCIIYEAKIINK